MMVVDSNMIAYLYISGEYSALVESVLRKDPVWAAPYRWRSEFRNILALYVRQQLLSLGDALQIMETATALMAPREYHVVSHAVLKLSAESGCSAYDAEFVALGHEMDIPLVTGDKQLLSRFPARAQSPSAFLASPLAD
jgi:predicted nucleic acid-binding protein